MENRKPSRLVRTAEDAPRLARLDSDLWAALSTAAGDRQRRLEDFAIGLSYRVDRWQEISEAEDLDVRALLGLPGAA